VDDSTRNPKAQSAAANEYFYLHTVHTVVQSAGLSNRNHGRPAGFCCGAVARFLANQRSFRWSIVAIKYRSASIARPS
jgi:hypothetical protein